MYEHKATVIYMLKLQGHRFEQYSVIPSVIPKWKQSHWHRYNTKWRGSV